MIYAQFYHKSAISENGVSKLIPATGDRSVVIYDSRLNRSVIRLDAQKECHKRKYLGFKLFIGKSLANSHPITVLQIRSTVNIHELDMSEIGGAYSTF